MTPIEEQKLLEEIKAMRRPWYQRPDQIAVYISAIAALSGVAFQYSQLDASLLTAKAEKSLAEQEKVKAENEKFLITRQRIELSDQLAQHRKELSQLLEAHNRLLAVEKQPSAESQAVLASNTRFLAQIDQKLKEVTSLAATSPQPKNFYSWVDSLISSIFGLVTFIVGVTFLYTFINNRHPELIPELIRKLKRDGRNGDV